MRARLDGGRTVVLQMLMLAVLLITLPAPVYAQMFQPPEQFMSLSFGPAWTSISPPDFVWTDETFPGGLLVPDQKGGQIEFGFGAMVARQLAIMGGIGLYGGSGDIRTSPIHLYGGIRRWITRAFWLEGGAGPSYVRVAQGDGEAMVEAGNWGLGFLGAAGYDFVQKYASPSTGGAHLAAHVQARVSTNAAGGMRASTGAVLLGINVGW